MYAEKRPNGKWRGRYRDNDGQLRSAGTFTSKEAALAAAQERLDALDQPSDSVARMPLSYYFREHWLTQPHVTPATQVNYEGVFRNHVEGTLGHIPVEEVTTKQVRAIIKTHINEGRPHLANKIKACIGSVYRTLQEEEEVDFNPARGIKVKIPDPEPFIPIMPEDFHDILTQLPNEETRFFATFLAGTGLRYGEASALRVSDFDVSTNEIRVVRRVSRISRRASGDGTRHHISPTTKSGYNRLVPASAELAQAIVDYVNDRDLDGDDLIFRHRDLFPSDPHSRHDSDLVLWERWHEVFIKAVKDAGFESKGWTTHHLRHANATLLVSAGIDIIEIQRRLGHRSITTTQRYAHRVKASQSKAAAATNVFMPTK